MRGFVYHYLCCGFVSVETVVIFQYCHLSSYVILNNYISIFAVKYKLTQQKSFPKKKEDIITKDICQHFKIGKVLMN